MSKHSYCTLCSVQPSDQREKTRGGEGAGEDSDWAETLQQTNHITYNQAPELTATELTKSPKQDVGDGGNAENWGKWGGDGGNWRRGGREIAGTAHGMWVVEGCVVRCG